MTQQRFISKDGKEFWIDGLLVQKLDNIKKIIKRNWDCVILIDGRERSGKSTLGITCGYYLDPTITVNNLAKGTADAIKKIEQLPDKSILIIDEGSLVLNSKDSMAKEQKRLMKILDVVGQKNMVFIIILPSVFNLSRDIVTRRARFLLHVYTDKNLTRGRFGYYSERQLPILYDKGKKKFNKYTIPARFYGRFNDFLPFGTDYFDTKRETLMLALHEDDKKESKREQRLEKWLQGVLHLTTKENKFISQREMSRQLKEKYDISLSNNNMSVLTGGVQTLMLNANN